MPYLFLSPSTQKANLYVTEGSEQYWMNQLADRMEPYLTASGINVTRNDPNGSAVASIRQSNAGNYDFHLALHSNAAPESLSGQLRGIDAYYYPGSRWGYAMAQLVVDNLKPIYPLPQKVQTRASTSIGELRQTRAPSALIELGYHDNREDAMWLTGNLEKIALALCRAVTQYFGLPLLTPRPAEKAVVSTRQSPLNLRGGPGVNFPVLLQMPKGTLIEVLNEYRDWYVVRREGVVGYANRHFITLL